MLVVMFWDIHADVMVFNEPTKGQFSPSTPQRNHGRE